MQAGQQVLIWGTLILLLGFVLVNALHNQSLVEENVNTALLTDLTQVDLANLFDSFSESSDEELATEDRITATTLRRAGVATVAMNVYRVRQADTVWGIARAHHLDPYTILSVNKLNTPHQLRIGQTIRIPHQRGILHTVRRGDALRNLASHYGVSLRNIINANAIADANRIQVGTELFIPNARVPQTVRRNMFR